MAPPTPSAAFLADQVRWAMGRGLPAQVAEDVVFESWESAGVAFDPARGSFEAYLQVVVRNRCAYWWREQARAERAGTQLRILSPRASTAAEERAAGHQQAVIDALDDDERKVFAAWALQKHLGKGRVSAAEVGRSIGLGESEFEGAKKRLKVQLKRILDRFGWTVADLLYGEDDVDQTG